MLQILPYLLLKKIHFATLYLIYKEEKLYPLQVNRDASAPVFVVGSVNVFNALVKGSGGTIDLIDMNDSKGVGNAASSISITHTLNFKNKLNGT